MKKVATYNQTKTSDVDLLLQLQEGKNRQYTQIQAGKFEAEYAQAWLGNVQIFRESVNVGARIQAAPPSSILPFSFILPTSENVRYCQSPLGNTNSITQATGGYWDVVFTKNLKYFSAAFERDYFFEGFQSIKEQEVPSDFLLSKTTQTMPELVNHYGLLISQALDLVQARPELLDDKPIMNLLSSQLLAAVIDTLTAKNIGDSKLPKLKKRQRGVNNVIDYLQTHAAELPDIQTLCSVAELSERSLQYGFMEALGITPIQYLRLVRLNGAKRSLEQANPNFNRVVDVATQWGFVELGRFSKEYKSLFCELPSQTLARY